MTCFSVNKADNQTVCINTTIHLTLHILMFIFKLSWYIPNAVAKNWKEVYEDNQMVKNTGSSYTQILDFREFCLSIHSCTVRLFQSKVNSIQTHTLTHNITGFLHLRLFSNSTCSLFSSKAFWVVLTGLSTQLYFYYSF